MVANENARILNKSLVKTFWLTNIKLLIILINNAISSSPHLNQNRIIHPTSLTLTHHRCITHHRHHPSQASRVRVIHGAESCDFHTVPAYRTLTLVDTSPQSPTGLEHTQNTTGTGARPRIALMMVTGPPSSHRSLSPPSPPDAPILTRKPTHASRSNSYPLHSHLDVA